MITMKKLNVVKVAETEEKAAQLAQQGFKRVGRNVRAENTKTKKAAKKEGKDGGADQPDRADGTKQP